MTLKIKRLTPEAAIPRYAHPDDSGLDLCSVEDRVLQPGEWASIRTGIAIALPEGTEAQIRPRSGLAAKSAISILNTPGTVDEGYRGEVCVVLVNHGREPFEVVRGMRIAQMVVCPILRPAIKVCGELDDTTRGSRGFGSTGL
ncbi:MAG: dUTP diphosphatase [Kiritimatiellia bacterium]|jgi:dUTP pyrophosphatase